MPGLTVLIPCKDERLNIAACIASVRAIATEILVADSGSTDGTLEIVAELGGCRVIEREYVNSADFKNWAIPQAACEWVLVVDADERVSPELAAEIQQVLASEPACDAFRIPRQNFFLGHPIHYCGWNTATLTRLFRRDAGRYAERRVHSDVEVPSGRYGDLAGKFWHYTAWDLAAFVAKQNRYSSWSAEDAFEQGHQAGYFTCLCHAPLRFLQLYLVRGGIWDGFPGLVVCLLMAFYTFLKEAKLWALANTLDHPAGQPYVSPKRHGVARAAPGEVGGEDEAPRDGRRAA